jgi:vacuolar-type H+-ATPase subunit I/STV1
VDERALDELRRLARRDRELEEEAAALRALDAEVAAIRRGAEAIAAFFSTYQAEEERRVSDLHEARVELAHRHEELQQAERDAATARDEAAREHAEKAAGRARDHVSVAETRLDRAQAARAELEAAAAARPAELAALDTRGSALADVPPPADDLSEWASLAHADLFVAAGQIDAQRERLIREANELASMLIGEATYGSTAAQALGQAERYWTSSPGHVSERR